MSNVTQNARVNVYINGQSARAEIDALERKATQLRNEINKVGRESDIGKGLQKQLNGVNSELKELQKQGGLATMSLKQLKAEQQALTRLRNQATPNSEAWNNYNSQLKAVRTRINDVTNELGPFARAWQSVSLEAKLAFGLLAGNAIINWVGSNARALGDFDDALADVRKVTGLTTQQVKGINDELGKMNTRTARAELLELAYAGGKLGNQTTQDVLAFVRAADQINVALGKDLGRDAITQIGKLTDIFKLKEEFGLEKGMLKIASAINDIGMASTATEGYLVEFAKRMSGVSGIANISAPEIIGLAGTLDSLGQTAEVSSTALSKLLTKMGGDIATFARMAGMSEDAFRKLMGESGLKALLAVIERVGQSGGGLETLAAQLGDIGLDGGRVVGVLGTLAKNMDEVRRQTDIANKAFEQGTSITEEFNIKNATLGATLDKLGKDMRSLFVNQTTKETLKALVGVVVDFVRVLKENKDVLKTVAVEIGKVAAIWVMLKGSIWLSTVASNAYAKSSLFLADVKLLLTARVNMASGAFRLFGNIIKNNPIVFAVTAIYGLVKGIELLNDTIIKYSESERIRVQMLNQAKDATNALAVVQEYFNGLMQNYLNLSKEQRAEEMKKLDFAIRKAKVEKQAMLQRIEQFKQEEGYYRNIETLSNLKFASEEEKQAKIRKWKTDFVNNDRFREMQKGVNAVSAEIEKLENIAMEFMKMEFAEDIADSIAGKTINQLEEKLRKYTDALNMATEESEEFFRIQKKIADTEGKLTKLRKSGASAGESVAGKGTGTPKDMTSQLERIREQNNQFNEELLAMNESADEAMIEKTRNKYQKLIFETEQFIKQQKEIIGKSSSTAEEKKIANANLKLAQDELTKTYQYMEEAVGLKEKELAERRLKARKEAEDKIDNMLELSDKEKTEKEIARTIVKYDELIKLAEKYGYKVAELRRAMYNEIASLRNRDARAEAQNTGDLIARINEFNARSIGNRNAFGMQGAVDVSVIQEQKRNIEEYIALVERQIVANESIGVSSDELRIQLENLKNGYAALSDGEILGELANKIEFVGNVMLNAGNSINDLLSTQADERVNIARSEADRRLEALDKLHKNGAISEKQYAAQQKKIQSDLATEERKAQRETAKRQKALALFQIALSTTVGIMSALAMLPPNVPLSVSIGVTGGLQFAAAAARPLPQLSKGKRFEGEQHKSSAYDDHLIVYDFKKGQPVASVEGGETLLSRKTRANNMALVDKLLYVSQFENGRTLTPEELYGMPGRVNTTEMPTIIKSNQMGNGGRFNSTDTGAMQHSSLLISKIDQLIAANNKLIEVSQQNRHVIFSQQRYDEFQENIKYFDQYRKP